MSYTGMTTSSPPAKAALYDDALLGILQNEGKIAPFLDVIFGFLHRRTDFFKPLTSNGKLGFAPGAAKKLAGEAFRNYEQLADAERKKSREIPTIQISVPQDNPPATEPDSTMTSPETGERRPIPRITAHPAEDPGNGAVHDKFAWNQTNHDLDVRVYVPRSVTKSKQLQVDLKKNSLKIAVKGSDNEALLEGTFRWPINSAESMWIFVPGEYVQMTLEKERDGWWDSLLVGEGVIDLTKIDAEMAFTDLGSEEQQAIRKIVNDQKMQALGQPTSQQEEMAAVLKKAWNVEGSPFKGQPFDPAVVGNMVRKTT